MPAVRPLADPFAFQPPPPLPEPIIDNVDAAALAAITEIYREIMPEGGAILDVMSSWVSHLPPETAYRRVAGIGMDACVLAENPFLDEWRVQDLNRNPTLPYGNGEFDGAAICGAIQHLTRPAEVIREIGRVLRPGAPLVVTFSQRCLATKAIACWCLLDDTAQLCLVARHFVEAGNWTDIRCIDRTPPSGGVPLYAVIAKSRGTAFSGHSD
ncbi:MAG TPA: methyltransferase domain-containing protein [Stellaceae bacterium]|jgi:SAM-dependent methyltransferase|nr:methyltransferase domain-containing protein [Stellaceae bacterium]